MGKNQSASNLPNIIQYSNGNINFVSGSTLLMQISSSGAITTTGVISGSNALSSSYAVNSDQLDGFDSTAFVFTSSFNTYSSSMSTRVSNTESTGSTLTTASASFAVVSSSYSAASGSLSTRVTTLEAASASLNTASGSFSTRTTTLENASSSLNTASGSFSTRVTKIEGNYATTGSNVFIGTQVITGSVLVTSSLSVTGCIVSTGQIVAQTINVQQVTSSVVYSCGSNVFGCNITDTQRMTGSVLVTGSLNVTGNTCVTSICSPAYVGGTFSGTTVSGTTLYGSTAACAPTILGTTVICGPTICGGTVCGTVGCFASVCSPAHIGGTFSGTTVSGTTLYGSTAVCSPTILGTTVVSGSVGCFVSICSPTHIGGTFSGTTNYASTVACSPVGCFTTSCASTFSGGTFSGTTISGTTIYGSTNLCGPSVCTTDGFHCSLRMACKILPISNFRTTDCGYGGIDFFDNTIGYGCAAKFYTFRSNLGEYYGLTNDYNGIAQLALISSGSGGSNNISFFTGTSTTARLRIDNNASCFSQTVCATNIVINGSTACVNINRTDGTPAVLQLGNTSNSYQIQFTCTGGQRLAFINGAPTEYASFFGTGIACFSGRVCASALSADGAAIRYADFQNYSFQIGTDTFSGGFYVYQPAGYRFTIKDGGVAVFACQVCTAGSFVALGCIAGLSESTYIGVDAGQVPRLGFMKKPGIQPFLVYAQDSFTIASSSGATIDPANTFTARLTISTAGVSCFSGLVCTPSGHRFGGGSTTLNYYEEGTWTPVLQGAITAGTVGYANRSASYVRIGNYVYVRWGFQLNSISSAVGTVRITGLPFTAVNWGSYQEPSVSVGTGNLACAQYAGLARMYVEGGGTALQGRVMINTDTGWDINQFSGDEWIIGEIFYNV